MATIGERIRRLREEKEMTLLELEKLSGIRAGTVSDIERNRIKSPAFDTVISLSNALGVSPVYFCDKKNINLEEDEKALSVLSGDIKKSLLEDDFLPYLVMIQKAYKKGIPSKFIKTVIEALEAGIERRIKEED